MQDVESQWLTQALNGDVDAFSQLVDTYQTPVYNLCYRMLSDPYEAEDAAQETFLRAFRSVERYDRSRPFSTWLLSIAAHYCIDQIRRRRMKIVPIDLLPYEEVADPAPNPEAQYTQSEEQRRVQTLLQTLNPTDRAALVMLYWNELSYEEIAVALNLTVSAVKSRLHRTRRELAQTWVEQSTQANIQVTVHPAERTRYESPAL